MPIPETAAQHLQQLVQKLAKVGANAVPNVGVDRHRIRLLKALPDRGFGHCVLVLAPRFADHERHADRAFGEAEMAAEHGLQPIQRGQVLAVLLETADPFFAWRVFFEPGVGAR